MSLKRLSMCVNEQLPGFFSFIWGGKAACVVYNEGKFSNVQTMIS